MSERNKRTIRLLQLTALLLALSPLVTHATSVRRVNVTEQVADYTPGWGGWRGQHDEILAALFPAEPEE